MDSQPDTSAPCILRTAEVPFRPETLPTEQLELARGAFHRFLDRVAIALPGYLGSAVDIGYAGAEQLPFSAAIANVEKGAAVTPLDLSPYPCRAHLALGRQLVGAVLDNLLGASKEAAEIPRTFLTAVDLQVLQDLIELLAVEITTTWEPVCGCPFVSLPATPPETADAGCNAGSTLVLKAEIVLNGATSTLQLMVPSLLIRLAYARQNGAAAAQASNENLTEAVSRSSLGVEAVLRGAGIRAGDLLALKAGHMLTLPYRTDEPLECQINGVVKYRGELVNNGDSLGLRVVSET